MSRKTLTVVSLSLLLFPLLHILVTSPQCFSQSVIFEKSYFLGDYSRAGAVVSTPDSGAIIVGKEVQGANINVLFLRIDAYGDTLWTRTLTIPGEGSAGGVAKTKSGDYVLTGYVYVTEASYLVLLVKFTQEGDTIWTSLFDVGGAAVGCSVLETIDGGFLVFGYRSSGSASDALIIRTDNKGKMLRNHLYGFVPGQTNNFMGAVRYQDSLYYAIGNISINAAGDRRMWLVRVDSDGDTLWTRRHSSTGQVANAQCIDASDSGIFVAGYVDAQTSDCYVGRFAHQGAFLKEWWYGGTSFDDGRSIVALPDGGFATVGVTKSFGGGTPKVYLVRARGNGDTIWTKFLGSSPDQDIGSGLTLGVDNKLLVVGQSLVGTMGVYIAEISVPPVVGVEEVAVKSRYEAFSLSANYPNPFNPTTVVRYQLPVVSEVRLAVYDILGREVAVLVNERKIPGSYEVNFNADGLASGVYFYRLQARDFVQTKRLVILK